MEYLFLFIFGWLITGFIAGTFIISSKNFEEVHNSVWNRARINQITSKPTNPKLFVLVLFTLLGVPILCSELKDKIIKR